MKTSVKNITTGNLYSFQIIPIVNDNKNYANDPVAIKKKEEAIALLKRIGWIKE